MTSETKDKPMAKSRSAGSTAATTQRTRKPLDREARELVETAVSVLILVSLLRMFGAEAFVIPTGSMATTLLGAHKKVTCPQCGHVSLWNASQEAEAKEEDDRLRREIRSGLCQNCRIPLQTDNAPSGGDRVVVAKYLYDTFDEPERWHVVVFKCPEYMKARINFIKRLIGRPGEVVQIRYGDIWVGNWKSTQSDDFHMARKPPATMLAMRRLVFDNDKQPGDLVALRLQPRWFAEGDWSKVDATSFESTENGLGSLTYRHVVGGGGRLNDDAPTLISDFEAYNTGEVAHMASYLPPVNWVGDLMLECRLNVHQLSGVITFELVEAARAYRCTWRPADGEVLLSLNGQEIARSTLPVGGPGEVDVRFANFDDRLTFWLDNQLVFGDGVAVPPLSESESGPRREDLQPVRVMFDKAAMTVSRLKLYRDTYYTQTAREADYEPHDRQSSPSEPQLAHWRTRLVEKMQFDPTRQYVIGSEQFLMLGDNSPSSQDSREWSEDARVVDRKLVLGRALVLYWPPWHWKFIQ